MDAQRKWHAGRAWHAAVSDRFAVAIVLIAALIEAAIVYWRWAPSLPGLLEPVLGILSGTPMWMTFQNRVLCPWVIAALSRTTGIGLVPAYVVFMGAAILAKDVATFAALRRFRGTAGALLPTLAAMVLFVLLQSIWIYPWDPIDGIISAAVVYVAGGGAGWVLAAAFALALLNRESSAYVGIYLLIEAIAHPSPWRLLPVVPGRPRWPTLALGTAALVGAIGVTIALRRLLLVTETMTGVPGGSPWSDYGPREPGWHYNLGLLERLFAPDRDALQMAAWLAVALVLIVILVRLWSVDFRLRKLALLALAEFVAIVMAAVVLELRVFSGLLPFLVLFAFSSDDRAPKAETPPRAV